MNEKLYKSIIHSGKGSITVGIIALVVGIATGVIMIINGARLLKAKSDTLF